MQSKSLLIAIAAFAVTASGAQAYIGSTSLLSSNQVAAFAEARELKEKGEVVKARDVLIKAGIDEETISDLRKANKESRQAIKVAVTDNDYAAFKLAAANSPLIDIITTEEDFQLFRQAHELHGKGSHKEAIEIFTELGLPAKSHFVHRGKHHHRELLSELSDDQKEAFRVAKEANDKETMKAILLEAGVSDIKPRGQHKS